MEFKFNFNFGDPAHDEDSPDSNEQGPSDLRAEDQETLASVIQVEDIIKHWSSKSSSHMYEVENVTVLKSQNQSFVVATPTSAREDTDADLIPDTYEGGFKIWECTIDLVHYLAEEKGLEFLKDKVVLDLGCGVGVLGMYALIHGFSSHVTFQDFNKSVIVESTGPSSLWNLRRQMSLVESGRDCATDAGDLVAPVKKRRFDGGGSSVFDIDSLIRDEKLSELASGKMDFLVGDWGSLNDCSYIDRRYDVILSSETIYNTCSYPKLHDFLKSSLSPNGTVIMSAKSHYFGVGGGTDAWFDFVARRNIFEVEVVHSFNANLQRKVFCMKFKRDG